MAPMTTMPPARPARRLGIVLSRQETVQNIQRAISAGKAMLKEIGPWRPDAVVPEFGNAMRDVAAAAPLMDLLEARLARGAPGPALSDDEAAVLIRWQDAVDRAHRIWAEQTRPTITSDQAGRLLRLAKGAKAIVDSAILRAADPQATDEDRAAAATLGRCTDEIIAAGATVDLLIARLQKAVDSGRGAHVTALEVAAVESFAGCAMELPPAKPRPAALTPAPRTSPAIQAVIGAGLPTAAAIVVGLLRRK